MYFHIVYTVKGSRAKHTNTHPCTFRQKNHFLGILLLSMLQNIPNKRRQVVFFSGKLNLNNYLVDVSKRGRVKGREKGLKRDRKG